tara:strand:+ start:78 stop:341 length:264 start_codon:yes stop_codon:yes gene_type:complete
MSTNVQNLHDQSAIDTASKLANTILRVGISAGNITLNTGAQIEDESLTYRFKGALKNQESRDSLIQNSPNPAAAQALFDKIKESNLS